MESNIAGTRPFLRPWAMEHARRYALLRNIEVAAYNAAVSGPDDVMDPVAVEDLFISGGHDEGTFVFWEVQDGGGWIITVGADFTTGKVTVEG